MQALLAALAIVAGLSSALQSGSNGTLAKVLSTPAWAGVVVAAVLLCCMLLVACGAAVFAGQRPPPPASWAAVPAWAWCGGVFGAVFLLATIFAAPRLGAGVFIAVVVTSSTLMSLALDHWGLMGFEPRAASFGRLAGAALMAVGVALIAAF